jgi:tetratricopeptide (TPR) repeat protein
LILRLLTFAGLCISACCIYSQKIDSLLKVGKDASDTIIKVDALNEAIYELRNINPDTAILISNHSEYLAELINYPLGIANAKMHRATAFAAQGNYYEALQLFLNAKTTFEQLENKEQVAFSLSNIGRIYNFIDDFDRALEYYEASVTLFAEVKNIGREGTSLNNIGYVYKLLGDYDKSLEYLRISLKKTTQSGEKGYQVFPIYNIGSVYMLSNELDSASKYLNEALELSYQLPNNYILSLTLIDLGNLYLKTNEISKAEKCFHEAYEVASDAGMRSEKRDAALQLSEVKELQHKYKEALAYHKIYKTINIALFNRDLAQRMAFQEAEYEFTQKQIQNEIELSKAQLEQEKILSNARLIQYTLIGGIVTMILICYLFYINFIRKRMANEALRKLNHQIELQADELRSANEEITEMNNNLESIVNQRTQELKLRNRQLKEYLSSNSHIVRAPLARILGLVDLYEPGDQQNLDFINQSIQASAIELDNVLREINQKLSQHEA